jgi:hypothetical protein
VRFGCSTKTGTPEMILSARYILSFLAAIAVATILNCSVQNSASGGTDVGNGRLTGAIVDKNGTPVAGAHIRLFSHRHDPSVQNNPLDGAYKEAYTGTDGYYRFDSMNIDTYNIEASHYGKAMSAFHFSILSDSSAATDAGTDTIRAPGRIKVELPDSGMESGGYFCIPGTSFYHVLTADEIYIREFILDSVPCGLIPEFYYRSSPNSDYVIRAATEIEVSNSGMLTVEFERGQELPYHLYFSE